MKYKHICQICNFETDYKSNYNRHIQTKKHQLNHEIHVAKSKVLPKQCPNCLKKFSTVSVKNRHVQKCIMRVLLFLEF